MLINLLKSFCQEIPEVRIVLIDKVLTGIAAFITLNQRVGGSIPPRLTRIIRGSGLASCHISLIWQDARPDPLCLSFALQRPEDRYEDHGDEEHHQCQWQPYPYEVTKAVSAGTIDKHRGRFKRGNK